MTLQVDILLKYAELLLEDRKLPQFFKVRGSHIPLLCRNTHHSVLRGPGGCGEGDERRKEKGQ